jgi:deoxycytidylate deaminase
MAPKDTLLNLLCNEAKKSVVDQQLGAVIIKSGKIINKPSCNTARNLCRGVISGSLHAEARAIVNYFGDAISFDRKKGWCVQRDKVKKSET